MRNQPEFGRDKDGHALYEHECPVCKKKFVAVKRRKFCSIGCSVTLSNRRRLGPLSNFWISGRTEDERVESYKQEHPNRVKAVNDLNYAVESGRVTKGTVCEICGTSGEKIAGHHQEYSEPLKVNWLCYSCHKKVHDTVSLVVELTSLEITKCQSLT